MDCGQFRLPCCVGICCRVVGVHLMLGSEGLRPSLRSIRRTPSQLHSLQQIPTQHGKQN